MESGSIRLKVLDNLTAGLTGWLYLRGSCAPCRLRLSKFGGCRDSTPLSKLGPPSAQYRTSQRRTPLVPYSAHDPPVSLPYASDSARSPEGKSGTRQGRRRTETTTCLTSCTHSCCRACQSHRLRAFGRVSFRRVGSPVKNSSQLQTNSKRGCS